MFENIKRNLLSDGLCRSATGWNGSLDLQNFPTKPEHSQIKVDGENLVVSGKTDVSKERNVFKVLSTHIWSKEFKLHNTIDEASINKQNLLRITAQHEQKRDVQFEIPIQMK